MNCSCLIIQFSVSVLFFILTLGESLFPNAEIFKDLNDQQSLSNYVKERCLVTAGKPRIHAECNPVLVADLLCRFIQVNFVGFIYSQPLAQYFRIVITFFISYRSIHIVELVLQKRLIIQRCGRTKIIWLRFWLFLYLTFSFFSL